MAITTVISPQPPVMHRDEVLVFPEDQDTYVSLMEANRDFFSGTTIPQLNSFSSQINSTEASINAKEANAVSAANEASVSALSAQGSANYQGAWTSKGYTVGQTVSDTSGIRWLCKLTHTTAQTVGEGAYWTIAIPYVGAIGNITSPLLDMPLKNSLAMKAGVGSATFTRASTATYIDMYGVMKTAAVDEPRFEKEGYLNEGASTNLVLNSDTLATQTITVTSGISYTLSFYGAGTVVISGAYIATVVGTALFPTRTTITFTTTSTSITLTPTGTCSYAQLEALSFATSYIPTVASTVTRAADNLTLSAGGNYNLPADAKTILIDYDILGYGTVNQNLFDLPSTSQFNRIMSFTTTTAAPNQRPTCYYSGGVIAFTASSVPANTKNRLAYVLPSGTATQNVTRYFNGVFYAAVSQTIASNTAPTTIYVGRANGSTLFNHFGHISNVRVYDKALSATEIALA